MTTAKSDRVSSKVLSQVKEGMDVYDKDRNRVGSVEGVFFGATADEETENVTPATAPAHRDVTENSFLEPMADVFDPRDEVPEEVAERLRYHGFIRIDSGWFGSDRYVMPEQITSVSNDGVFLSTSKDRLIKG